MFNIKKKLNALIPGESARGALQNVLTVEWSGHKTVLVEVPTSGPSRSNEMEMSGMGDGGDYGRLIDDDQEERDYFKQTRERFDQSRFIGIPDFKEERDYFKQTRERFDQSRSISKESHSSSSSTLPLSKGPAAKRLNSNNPFASAYDTSDFEPQPLTDTRSHTYGAKTKNSSLDDDLLSFDEPQRGWKTFSGGPNQAPIDPWAGRNWGTGNGQGQTSPTSSTGTRFSGTQSIEDPFRN